MASAAKAIQAVQIEGGIGVLRVDGENVPEGEGGLVAEVERQKGEPQVVVTAAGTRRAIKRFANQRGRPSRVARLKGDDAFAVKAFRMIRLLPEEAAIKNRSLDQVSLRVKMGRRRDKPRSAGKGPGLP